MEEEQTGEEGKKRERYEEEAEILDCYMTKAAPGHRGEAPQPPEGREANPGAETIERGEPDPIPEAEAEDDQVPGRAYGVDPTREQESEDGDSEGHAREAGPRAAEDPEERREEGDRQEKGEERGVCNNSRLKDS